jgi:glycolate oxidase FAD binding subunit
MSTKLAELGVHQHREEIHVPGATLETSFEPVSPAEVSEVVRAAAAEKAGLLISGGRTRLGCANQAHGIRAGLSLTQLAGIDEFEPDEGVLHAGAGTPIAQIREAARAEGWELPLDSSGARSTVGGTIASATTGPRALAFGSVSDAILGLDVVGGDGLVSKCGGRVVKNVTGYDLAKLYCGSHGSLAVLTGAWLRLRPAAGVCETYRCEVASSVEAFERIRKLARLTSVRALVWCEAPNEERSEVVVELGGSEEGVAHDRARFSEAVILEAVEDDRIDVLRDARAEIAEGEDMVVLRARVLLSRCERMRRELLAAGLSVSIDPGLGVLLGRGSLADSEKLLSIRECAEAAGGFATFEQVPDAWRSQLDVFGSQGGTESLASTLKEKLDPAGILNPGRFLPVRRLESGLGSGPTNGTEGSS